MVRGAVGHWPAVSQWGPEFLREEIGSLPVGTSGPGVLFEPIVEIGLDRMVQPPNKMQFFEFLDEVERSDGRVQLYSEHLHALEPLRKGLGPVDFLDEGALPSRFYGERFFVSKRGYTDRHVHFGDETLTARVDGAKGILLLPPDNSTFSTMFAMARRGVWKIPEASWPADFAALDAVSSRARTRRRRVHPDAWWHAVEALDDDLNLDVRPSVRQPVTVARGGAAEERALLVDRLLDIVGVRHADVPSAAAAGEDRPIELDDRQWRSLGASGERSSTGGA